MVNRRSVLLGAALLAALAVAGCGQEETAEVTGTAPEQQGEEVAILRSFPPQTSGGLADPLKEVLKDGTSFEALWRRANSHLAPVPAPPGVDFAREMVAVIALGTKSTSGFAIEIVGAREHEGRTRLLYSIRRPEPEEMTAAVLTAPWHAVVLPRSDLPVEWVEYVPPGRR